MALLVLAYPEISKNDYDWIQDFRKHQDELYYQIVDSHFTLVFPVFDWSIDPFVTEIEKQSQTFEPFGFCIRCATLNKDAFGDYYHTFLVPDEGYSRLVKMHDKLYADKLFSNRRLDIDFIPHIGIGNSKDPLKCNEMANSWNEQEFEIRGRIAVLDIVQYEDNKVQTLQRIALGQ